MAERGDSCTGKPVQRRGRKAIGPRCVHQGGRAAGNGGCGRLCMLVCGQAGIAPSDRGGKHEDVVSKHAHGVDACHPTKGRTTAGAAHGAGAADLSGRAHGRRVRSTGRGRRHHIHRTGAAGSADRHHHDDQGRTRRELLALLRVRHDVRSVHKTDGHHAGYRRAARRGGDHGPLAQHPLLLPYEIHHRWWRHLDYAHRALLLDQAGRGQHLHLRHHHRLARRYPAWERVQLDE